MSEFGARFPGTASTPATIIPLEPTGTFGARCRNECVEQELDGNVDGFDLSRKAFKHMHAAMLIDYQRVDTGGRDTPVGTETRLSWPHFAGCRVYVGGSVYQRGAHIE